MDKRQVIQGIAIALILVVGYYFFSGYLHRKYPDFNKPPEPAPVATPAPAPAPAPAPGPPVTPPDTQPDTQPSTNPSTGPAPAPVLRPGPGTLTVAPAGDGSLAAIGSATPDDPNFQMLMEVSPHGASIERIILNSYKNADDWYKPEKERGLYVFQKLYPEYSGDTRPLATQWITVDGQTIDLANVIWEPDAMPSSGDGTQSVAFATTVRRGDTDLLRVTKRYTLFPASHASLGYEVRIEQTVENLTGDAVRLKTTLNGPTLPPREAARPPDRQVISGYTEENGDITVESKTLDSFDKEKPTFDLTKNEDGRPLAWSGLSSVYFEALLLPINPAAQNTAEPAAAAPGAFAKVTATGMYVQVTGVDTEDRKVIMRYETPEVTLSARGEKSTTAVMAYFGPRHREVLETGYYAALPRQYSDSLVIKSGPCAFCTFDWLIWLLVKLLAWFHWLFGGFSGAGDWGLAIIALVCLVRTLLHPITKRSQVQMMKMGKMAPEVEKLKKKYGDNKEELNKAMMQLYREHGYGAGMILGCLPMLLQMPIWIALFSALQTTFELRQEPFLWGYTWIHDLAKPDYLIKFGRPLTLLFGWKLEAINLLPILMAVIFYVQFSIQNKIQPKGTPEQETQKKMMKWMSTLLFPLFLYNGPSGLNLYILTSTLIGIVESKIVRKHIKEREEAEKAGLVVVDAPAGNGKAGKRGRQEPAPVKKSWLARKMEELQAKAEEVRKEQERRKGR